jgi:heme O synthase-like polyprenyltransferase
LWFGKGLFYGLGAGLGGAIFLARSWRLHCRPTKRNAMGNFLASLLQLACLIVGILLDSAFGSWP